jgi:hypothetical protein
MKKRKKIDRKNHQNRKGTNLLLFCAFLFGVLMLNYSTGLAGLTTLAGALRAILTAVARARFGCAVLNFS